jgi:ribose transport system substrate-binding protein
MAIRRIRLMAAVAVALAVAAGCSSSKNDSGSAGGGTSSGSSGGGSAKGKVVWYLDITDANPLVTAIAQGINEQLTAAGASMVRTFALNNTTGNLDIAVQAEAMTRAQTSKPAAIAYFLMDPNSMKPQIERAQKNGIPVFAAFGKPNINVNAYININDDLQGYTSAKYLADHLPKGAKVAIIGGPPNPNVNVELAGAQRALKEAGVTIVGNLNQQRNLQDNAAGGQAVMQGILQRNPDVQGVFVYNDDSALGAIAAAKQAGKKIVFTARNGSTDGIAAIKAGDLLATCDIDPVGIGKTLGQALVQQISGSKKYENAEALPPPDASKCMVTKENVNQWKPYTELIKYQTIKTG